MRILHTSDWHLGRIFHGIHLTGDQAHVLDQLVGLVGEARPDVVLIAGDIYDRAVPPPEAVALLDDVLRRLVLDLATPVVLIAGNHDSPDRLAFGSRIMENEGLRIVGPFTAEARPVVLEDDAGPVHVYAVPYAEPALARDRLDDPSVRDHDSALAAALERIRAVHPREARSVLVAHAFVAGGEASESERPLSVGGAGTVDARRFAGFDYVALGHLHRSQSVGGDGIQYSGSLLKYSFSEVDHVKSVRLVEMDAGGACRVERIPLEPLHDVRRIEGRLEEILAEPERGRRREDYLTVRLLDREALFEPVARLREVYPNVLDIELPALGAGPGADGAGLDRRGMSDGELFASFYRQVTGEEISDEQAGAFVRVVDAMRREEREVTP
jgi:exonuclease SbcD